MHCLYPRCFPTHLTRTATLVLCAIFSASLLTSNASTRVQISVTPNTSLKRLLRVENSSIITFAAATEETGNDQIEVFNWSGQKILSLNPFRSLEGATRITLWDVSVGPTGLVAVAAVSSTPGKRPTMSLLIYSREGQLLRAFYVPPERAILKLEVDAEENIWTLGGGSNDKDPAALAMVTKYDKSGNVVKEFLPRSDFPMDAKITGEGPDIGGQASFGVTTERVWFWLPQPRQLVTMRKDGSDVRKFITGLPSWPGSETPQGKVEAEASRAYWLPSGEFVVEVLFRTGSSGRVGLHSWNPTTAAWKLIPYDTISSGNGHFWGIDQDQMVLVYRWARPGEALFDVGLEPMPVQ